MTGKLAGQHLNGNGQLSSLGGEISFVIFEFSGNTLVGEHDNRFVSPDVVVHDLNGGTLGDEGDESITLDEADWG